MLKDRIVRSQSTGSSEPQLTLENISRMLHEQLLNSGEVFRAWKNRMPLPALRMRNGLTLEHDHTDPTFVTFFETFVLQSYTQREFYKPQEGDTVLDIGANIGMFAMFLSSICNGIRVHCFEPAASTRDRLISNIHRNRLEESVAVYPYAVWNQQGKRRLNHSISSGDYSLFDRNSGQLDHHEFVTCIRLSEAVRMCGCEKVHLLKIDVEGAEPEILEGADMHVWKRIERIALEYHDCIRSNSRERIVTALRRNGYCTIRINADFPYSDELGIVQASRD